MKCEDCIHYQMCHSINVNAPCAAFKNKSDFVEVKWIDVNERLPENGRYIVYVKKEHHGGYKRDVFDLWYEDGKWYLDAHSALYGGTITHWMPLPEPPKMNEMNAKE